MIEHVRQRTTYDCGIAVAAMLTKYSYGHVRTTAVEECGLTPERGLSALALARLMTTLSPVGWGRRRPAALGPFGLARLTRFAALLAVDEKKCGHWVAVSGGRVYDPERAGATSIKSYETALDRHVAFVVARARE